MTVTLDNLIRTASDEAAIAEGCYFDADRAERAISYIERTFHVVLYVWQREILRLYFGWRRPDGTYRFTKVFVWVPKKNGKSWLVAVLLAYKLFELRNARLFSAAVNAKQAGIILDQAIKLLKASPAIRRMMKPRTGKVKAFNSPFRREIICDVTGSRYLSLADSPDAADGLIPDVQIFDEIHRMKNRTVDILDGNTANSPTCLRVIISTAGSGDKTHRSWQRYQETKAVLAGQVIDTQLLPIIHECPNADELKGEAIYNLDLLTACNPVLQEDPKRRAQAAREVDEARRLRNDNQWRRFRLGQWLALDGEVYIAPDEYAACQVEPVPEMDLVGCECYVGLDRGGTWDLTAATLLFVLPDSRVYEKHLAFAVADRLPAMAEADDIAYDPFAASGELTIVPAEAVMDEWITQHLLGVLGKYRVEAVAGDPHLAAYLLETLAAQGHQVFHVQQSNNRLLSPVIENFAERIRQGRMVHATNKLYDWQLSCARKLTCSKDTVKIVKAGSAKTGRGGTGHIDSIDATLNALAVLRSKELERVGNAGGIVIG